jgi:hypothetical protein
VQRFKDLLHDFFFDYSPYDTKWDEGRRVLAKFPSFALLPSDEERRKIYEEYAQDVINLVEGKTKRKEPDAATAERPTKRAKT